MKVAIVDSWFHWPPVGGAIRSVKEIADRLSARGEDVTLLAPQNMLIGAEDFKFRIEWLDRRHLNGPRFQSAIKQALRRISPDIVIVGTGNLMKPYMIRATKGFPTLVRLYAYELRCPASYGLLFREGHVCTYSLLREPHKCITCPEDMKRIRHNTALVDRPEFFASLKFAYPFYHLLVKSTVSKISMAIATSNYHKQQFDGIIPLDRIKVIPEGVDPTFFSPNGDHSPGGVKIITLAGRTFDPIKGLDVLLRAAALLWKRRQDFRLVVTGSGRSDIASHPFVKSDTWLDNKGIPEMYRSSDIVVVPSLWAETFGFTAVEAMSCEIPVIASRVGGLQEIVKDEENGLLVAPGNHVELASKLERLMDDADLRRRLGREGRKYVMQTYSWDKIIDTYNSVLRSVIDSYGADGVGRPARLSASAS